MKPRSRTLLAAVLLTVFVAAAAWFVWLFMGDSAVVRMSMARIVLIFTGLVCMFLFGCIIFVAVGIARRRHDNHS